MPRDRHLPSSKSTARWRFRGYSWTAAVVFLSTSIMLCKISPVRSFSTLLSGVVPQAARCGLRDNWRRRRESTDRVSRLFSKSLRDTTDSDESRNGGETAPPGDIQEVELSTLARAVQASIRQVQKHSGKSKVALTLSVSGGCDSVALLHACMESTKAEFCNTVQVVHFNHQQRGNSSDEDASFVERLCQDYGITCQMERWKDYNLDNNHEGAPSTTRLFSQNVARQWRRERLYNRTRHVMATLGGDSLAQHQDVDVVGCVMTAHHRDDSMESLALKALRGVHLLNLSGMKAMTPFYDDGSSDDNIFLVRPWVDAFTKQDLVDYLVDRNLPWRDDESNTSPKYLRNRVRNELLPLLQDFTDDGFINTRIPGWIQQSQELSSDVQPRVEHHLELVVTTMSSDALFNWAESCRFLQDTQAQLIHSSLIQSQALLQWINSRSSVTTISYETLQRVLGQLRSFPDRREWTMELGDGWNLLRTGDMLRVESKACTTRPSTSLPEIVWTATRLTTDPPSSRRGADRWPDSCQEMIVGRTTSDPTTSLEFREVSLLEYEEEHGKRDETAVYFVPPWKEGDSSHVKLRQFLRGQGVPLDRRGACRLLVAYMGSSSSSSQQQQEPTIVAVQCCGGLNSKKTDEWILHRDWCYRGATLDNNNDDKSSSLVAILVSRQDGRRKN